MTDNVTNMLVTDMRQLSLVEDDGFRTMTNTLQSGFTFSSRTNFTQPRKYHETFQKVKIAMEANNSKTAVTTDVWTSVATGASLGITCHYIKDDWDMVSVSLTTIPLQDRLAASNITEWLEEVGARFEILSRKIITNVHDNSDNFMAAANIL